MSINKQLHFVSLFLLLTGWGFAGPVDAATRSLQIEVRNAAGQIESKDLYSGYYALVIGIGEYDEWPDLPNAVSDAAEVASMLMNFGWDVELVANPTGYELEKNLLSLISKARNNTELGILVWYSGHGWTLPEYDGTPLGYLVPSDAPDPNKDELKFEQTTVSRTATRTTAPATTRTTAS